MSLPPSTIRIKRKLDEAPVRALYVDRSETKRQKVKKDFVFRLARTVSSPTDPNPPPFQPQPFPRPNSSGIPQVRSTLTPTSRSRQVSPTLISRTPSPHHAIGPLPAGSKLALDTTSGSSRRTTKPRVPLSAIARADSYSSVTESPGVLTPATETITPPTPRPESSDSDAPIRQGTFGSEKQHSLSSGENGTTKPVPSPSTTASKRKAAAAVRRYHLAKRLRIKHPHPYSTAATRRSAIFVRASSEPLTDEGGDADVEMDKEDLLEELVVVRKRPRTHPEEKRQIEEERRKAEEERLRIQAEKDAEDEQRKVRFKESSDQQEDEDPMTLAMQSMVLEYLNSSENAGMRNLPPTASPHRTPVKSKLQEKIGGGLGGGSWKDVDKRGEIDDEPEAEEGFVYDVYVREEMKEQDSKREGEDYGLIIIDGSDDEEWWYEGDEEVDSDDVYGSDDEDSNAEDYHTNDYPEEPLYDSDADGIDEFGILNDSDDDGDDESDYDDGGGMFRNWKKPVRGDDEEYDLEYDEDVDVAAEGIRQKMADIWGYRDVHGGKGEASGDEMEV